MEPVKTLTFRFEAGLCNARLSLQYEILLFHTLNPSHYCKIWCTKVIKTKRLPSHKRAATHYGDEKPPALGTLDVVFFLSEVHNTPPRFDDVVEGDPSRAGALKQTI